MDTVYIKLSTLPALSNLLLRKNSYEVGTLTIAIIHMKIKDVFKLQKSKKFANSRDGVFFLSLEPESLTIMLCHLSFESMSELFDAEALLHAEVIN